MYEKTSSFEDSFFLDFSYMEIILLIQKLKIGMMMKEMAIII